MAQESSADTESPLVYPQVGGPGIVGWLIACVVGLIGGAFGVFSIFAIRSMVHSIVHGKLDGPPAVVAVFFFVGLGVIAAAVAIVLYRDRIVIDPRKRTVIRCRSWGPIQRMCALPGEVNSVRLMHDTRGSGSGYNSSGSYTVCALSVMNRDGDMWHLSERPTRREVATSFFGRSYPEYEKLQRDEAIKLCAATGWRLDDQLECSETGFVPAASSPRVQKVEDIDLQIGPLIHPPAWLQRVAPRRVRRLGQTVMLSILGWGAIIVPIVATAIGVGVDAMSMRTTVGQVIGLARDGPGAERDTHGVGFRFAVDGQQYDQWEFHVPDALWEAAQKRSSIQVIYLPRDPHHSYIVSPSLMQLLSESWIVTNIKLIPSTLAAIALAVAMWRRRRRIAIARLLGERGRMAQGLIVRSAQIAGRSRASSSLQINGFPISDLWRSAENDPNQVRYEFLVNGSKRFGYVKADLLGVFRRDGLVGVVYDPLDPTVNMPVPAIERYFNIE